MKSIFLGVLALGIAFSGIAIAQDNLGATSASKSFNVPPNHSPTPGPGPQGGTPVVIKNGPVDNTPGSAPLGITINNGTGTVFVVSLFAGDTQLYDLGLNNIGSILNPAGSVTTTGIAYNTTDGFLYWAAPGAGAFFITDKNGSFLGSNPIMVGGGLIGGICINQITNLIWADDIADDAYYETTLVGVGTGNSFLNPDDVPPGTGAFGNGIAWRASSGLFDVPTGTLAVGQVDNIHHVDAAGNIISTVDVLSLGTFINGIDDTNTGSDGQPSTYVVENATNTLYEIEQGIPPTCIPPGGLSCNQAGPDYNLSWTNGEVYTSIEIFKDGASIAVLAGTATTYVDAGGVDGANHTFDVVGTCPNGDTGSATCSVVPTMGLVAILFLGLILLAGTFFVVTRRLQGRPVQA